MNDRATLAQLVEYFGAVPFGDAPRTARYVGQAAETNDDATVIARMFAASNGAKARDLAEGRWTAHYQSQSEADFAVINIIGFFAPNPTQIDRIFKSLPSYRPDKYDNRQNLIDGMVARALDRQPPQGNFAAIASQLGDVVSAAQIAPRNHVMPTCDTALPIVWASELATRAPMPPEWLVAAMIIARNVTLFYGDGGTGKSLLALMLAYCVAANVRWLGMMVRAGPALFLTAEDEIDEAHRRLAAISHMAGVELKDLPYPLAIASLADADALLAAVDPVSRTLRETELYNLLVRFIEQYRPAVVVLDTLADLFGGNENDRGQARWFIGILRRIAIQYNVAVILLAHPSRDGISTGRGDGGSTAWHNSVRSRLSLTRVESDPNRRVLETKKSNYGQIGETIDLEYREGTFVAIGKHSNDSAHKAASENAVDAVFLELVADFTARGQKLSPSPNSPTRYAPKLFAVHAKAKGTTLHGFKAAMTRLLSQGRIVEHVDRKDGRTETTIGLAL